MSAPSAAVWNTLGDGSSAITWVCGILSGVQLLKSTLTYVDNQSVGGLLRRGREQLKMLRDHAAKLTPQERCLIEMKKPKYLAGVEDFITRTDEFLDRVECDYRQGLLRTWKTYGPNVLNDVKKGLAKTESNTEKTLNDLMLIIIIPRAQATAYGDSLEPSPLMSLSAHWMQGMLHQEDDMVRHTTRSRWHIEWHLQLLAYLRAALQPGALMKAAPPARTTLAQGRRRILPPIIITALELGRLHAK
ncbi:hypothetical protein FOMPIDRAFT_89811 [Fomitopsis schrenkii]|uniref:Uncharacterized protein n=1 Tax=Fomitopsis schrenkii TaxID=2126942 RepID=S8E8W2_FOMSC|nr:hypothetical protein FOMPIDRAFT_89811 [Fomitopsis schrenkii]